MGKQIGKSDFQGGAHLGAAVKAALGDKIRYRQVGDAEPAGTGVAVIAVQNEGAVNRALPVPALNRQETRRFTVVMRQQFLKMRHNNLRQSADIENMVVNYPVMMLFYTKGDALSRESISALLFYC